MICTECYRKPNDINDIFFHIRFTPDGKDIPVGIYDEILCEVCLINHISKHGVSNIQSMIRIENPVIA